MEGMRHLLGSKSIHLKFSINLLIRIFVKVLVKRGIQEDVKTFLSFRTTLILSEDFRLFRSCHFRGNRTENLELIAD